MPGTGHSLDGGAIRASGELPIDEDTSGVTRFALVCATLELVFKGSCRHGYDSR